MVVTWSDIGGERAEGVERCFVASAHLAVHILFDFVHRHVSRSFDYHLYIVLPCTQSEFAQHIEFEELSLVVCVVYAAGAPSDMATSYWLRMLQISSK